MGRGRRARPAHARPPLRVLAMGREMQTEEVVKQVTVMQQQIEEVVKQVSVPQHQEVVRHVPEIFIEVLEQVSTGEFGKVDDARRPNDRLGLWKESGIPSDLTSGLFVFGGGAAASSQAIFSDNIFGPTTPGPSPALSQTPPSLSPSPTPSDCPDVDALRGATYSSCGGKGVRFQHPVVDAPDDLPEIPPFPTCDGIEVLVERLANVTCH